MTLSWNAWTKKTKGGLKGQSTILDNNRKNCCSEESATDKWNTRVPTIMWMARSDRREAIVLGEDDRALFLDTRGRVCEKPGWRVHASASMMQSSPLGIRDTQGQLLGFQTAYMALLAERHSKYTRTLSPSLNTKVTTSFDSGYRINFARNGSLQKTENSRHARPIRTRGRAFGLRRRNQQPSKGQNKWLLISHPDL